MLAILFFLTGAFLYPSMLDTDSSWTDRITVGSVPYDQASAAAGSTELDVLRSVLKDPDNLISSTFHIPKGLKDRVYFWAQIYAIYPSTSVVIHDRKNLAVIYRSVDGASIMRDTKVSVYTRDIRFKRKVASDKESVKKVLKNISRAGGIKYFSPKNAEERAIANIVKARMTNAESRSAYENVRTQSGQKDNIIKGLGSSSKYLPIIEDIFRENNTPWELTRLPFVESSFEIRAGSKVGAKGIWQIIDKTGKKYLETDTHYDERYSPFKASAVAARLLKDNYKILGTWPLAITAYNHGPGGVRHAMKKLRTNDISKIVSEYETARFGFASQNFYSEFLAALYVTVYSDRIFGSIEKEQPMNFSYVTMEKDMDMWSLSEICGLSVEEIQKYNPEFSRQVVEGKVKIKSGSRIKLPPRSSYRLEDHFIRSEDRKSMEKKLNSKGGINADINA